jgi:hypothetical protein
MGARSRRIRVTRLTHPDFRMALTVPHSHGEVAGVASFLGLRVVPPELYTARLVTLKLAVKVTPSRLTKNLWKTLEENSRPHRDRSW